MDSLSMVPKSSWKLLIYKVVVLVSVLNARCLWYRWRMILGTCCFRSDVIMISFPQYLAEGTGLCLQTYWVDIFKGLELLRCGICIHILAAL